MGEFEKRIKETVDSGLDAVNETIWKQFLEVVEEAKKEFPLPDEGYPFSEDARKYGEYWDTGKLCDWFEKWFGADDEG